MLNITEDDLHESADKLNDTANQYHYERLLTEVALFARNAKFLEKPGSTNRIEFDEPSLIFGIMLGVVASETKVFPASDDRA